jgi:hypothetical protein
LVRAKVTRRHGRIGFSVFEEMNLALVVDLEDLGRVVIAALILDVDIPAVEILAIKERLPAQPFV